MERGSRTEITSGTFFIATDEQEYDEEAIAAMCRWMEEERRENPALGRRGPHVTQNA